MTQIVFAKYFLAIAGCNISNEKIAKLEHKELKYKDKHGSIHFEGCFDDDLYRNFSDMIGLKSNIDIKDRNNIFTSILYYTIELLHKKMPVSDDILILMFEFCKLDGNDKLYNRFIDALNKIIHECLATHNNNQTNTNNNSNNINKNKNTNSDGTPKFMKSKLSEVHKSVELPHNSKNIDPTPMLSDLQIQTQTQAATLPRSPVRPLKENTIANLNPTPQSTSWHTDMTMNDFSRNNDKAQINHNYKERNYQWYKLYFLHSNIWLSQMKSNSGTNKVHSNDKDRNQSKNNSILFDNARNVVNNQLIEQKKFIWDNIKNEEKMDNNSFEKLLNIDIWCIVKKY